MRRKAASAKAAPKPAPKQVPKPALELDSEEFVFILDAAVREEYYR